MKKQIDPGSKFGRWTVLEDAPALNGKAMFKCQCDCGNIGVVSGTSLRRGISTSCGCYRKERALEGNHKRIKVENKTDLTGERFGRLTVIKLVEGNGITAKWLCKCDCGNEKIIVRNSLVRGLSTSCGCFQKENSSNKLNEYVGNLDGTKLSLINSTKIFSTNTTGVRGVSFNKNIQKYHAYIGFQGTLYNLGYYENIEDAKAAREKAEENLYGSFLQWYAENHPDKWKAIKDKKS